MDLFVIIQKLGLPLGLMVVILILGARRVWCFGYQLTDAEKRLTDQRADFEARLIVSQRREDEWKELALTGGRLSEILANRQRG